MLLPFLLLSFTVLGYALFYAARMSFMLTPHSREMA